MPTHRNRPVSSNVRRHTMTTALWFGILEEEILVFDPTMQLGNCPHVFLWSKREGMQRYVPGLLRSRIRTLKDAQLQQATSSSFEGWKLLEDTEAWLEMQRQYYQEREGREVAEKVRRKARDEALLIAGTTKKVAPNYEQSESERRRQEEQEYEARLREENFSGRYGGSFENAPANYASDHPNDAAGPFPTDF